MAARKSTKDMFPNIITASITMSAANTLTFEEINVGLNIFDKVGLLLQRIIYEPTVGTWSDLEASGDTIQGAICNDDGIDDLDVNRQQIFDKVVVRRHDMGTAASGWIHRKEITADYSTLSGGGILIPPKPLYLAMGSSGLAAAGAMKVRIYFTMVKLADADYLELLETRRAFG